MQAATSLFLCIQCLLMASLSFVLDLMPCFSINLVWPKCAMFIKPAGVYSHVLGLHTHCYFTHSLTHPEESAVPQAPLEAGTLYRYAVFYLLHHIFTVPVLCLPLFQYTSIVVLQLAVVFSTVTCRPGW